MRTVLVKNSPPIDVNILHKQRGFVLTVEFILITTILIIGSFVGVIAIRDALIKYKFKQLDRSVIVSDANNRVLGPMVGFDEHEAPLLFFIDRTLSPDNEGREQAFRALIGIRDDRFTSREPIYYTQLNCKGDPCIKPTSSERLDNRGVDIASTDTGAVSYFHALQDGPNYAIGQDPSGGLKGFLYRESVEACPVNVITAVTGSRYISQKVVFGSPCESPFTLPLPTGDAPRLCPSQANDGSLLCPQVGPDACGVTERNGQNKCACPDGYYDAGSLLGLSAGQCCPEGTTAEAGLIGITCSGPGLVKAESVPSVSDPSQNALEGYQPPFNVNLPAAGSSGEEWRYTPPESEN